MYELREGLVSLAYRLAADRSDTKLVQTLVNLWQKQKEAAAKGDLEAYGDLEMEFHRTIWEASGNRRLYRVAQNLDGHVRFLINTSAGVLGRLSSSIEEHHEIKEAIARRDALSSEAAMRAHIRNAWQALRRLFGPETSRELYLGKKL
ncbi:GntR family transcriptional regulator [Thermus albus]|uniref:GntR family transcriptional regulator n=1 Tax=Thermus albus TaxID=2908146 RepID=UPI003C12C250